MPGNSLPPPKHRLLLELGRGGMGTVYLAIAEGPAGFSKLKVVKQLRPDLAAEPQFLQMFLEEARLAARLNHPNVVQTFEVAFDGQRFYLEMEYLEGQSFDALLRRARKGDRPLSVAMAVWMLTQILAGLHYAHELADVSGKPLRVVHRDVSPHNAFVTYDGAVKVLDFGIAKAADSGVDTRTGVVKGKTTYMAPEQAVRAPVDRRADVFAVGVMLWELLAGKRFWGELSDPEIFQRLELGVFDRPRDIRPETPETLDAICMKALARNPDDRFATAADMQIALEDWLAGSGERVGPRQVGALMTELFAERRAAIRTEIEGQVARAAAEPHTLVEVPMLGANLEPSQPTAGSGISKEVLDALAARGRSSGARVAAASGVETNGAETGVATPMGREKGGPKSGQFEADGAARLEEPTRTGHAVTSEAPSRPRGRGGMSGLGKPALVVAAVVAIALGWTLLGRSRVQPVASSPAAPVAGCRGHGECTRAHDGRPHMCVAGSCVPLQTDACQVLAEPHDAENDGTLWFGAMLALTGPGAEGRGRPTLHAIDVARQDFARISHGLPSSDGRSGARPVGIVACNDADGASGALKHLVDELHVSAVIGFGNAPDNVFDYAQSKLAPNDVLAIATLNVSPLLASLPNRPGEPRMFWRTIPSYTAYARPEASVLAELIEPRLHGAPLKSKTIRVAVLRDRGITGVAQDQLSSVLRFNGTGAAENGDNYRELLMAFSGPARDKLVENIIAFAPHVIVGGIDDEVFNGIVLPLEDRWPRSRPFTPIFVMDGGIADSAYQFFHDHPEQQNNFFTINTPASTPENFSFTARYNEGYSAPVTPFDAPGMGYDAFYLLAYATYALGEQPVTGPNIARAISRLVPPGNRVDVGPSQILEALSALRKGANIDLNGTVTTLDFDMTTGDAPADFAIYVPQRDERAKSVTAIESGLVYDAKTGHIRGTSHWSPVKEH